MISGLGYSSSWYRSPWYTSIFWLCMLLVRTISEIKRNQEGEAGKKRWGKYIIVQRNPTLEPAPSCRWISNFTSNSKAMETPQNIAMPVPQFPHSYPWHRSSCPLISLNKILTARNGSWRSVSAFWKIYSHRTAMNIFYSGKKLSRASSSKIPGTRTDKSPFQLHKWLLNLF